MKMSVDELQDLILNYAVHRDQMKSLRKKLLRQIREHKSLFKHDKWILKKIGGGYLGDLSDYQVETYATEIVNERERLDGSTPT